jgi:ATP-dependent Lon protease
VIWVATANDERAIPEPILNRMNVFEVQAPDRDAARTIALRLYRQRSAAQHDWGSASPPEPADAVLDASGRTWRRARCGAPG